MINLTTGQLISITDGRLACDIGDVYKALDAITGDNLFTHQLPRASRFVEPFLAELHPWVRDLPPMPSLDGLPTEDVADVVYGWVDRISAEHGSEHEAPDLSAQWTPGDPLAELSDMLDGGKSDG